MKVSKTNKSPSFSSVRARRSVATYGVLRLGNLVPTGAVSAVPVEAIKFNFTDNINRSRHCLEHPCSKPFGLRENPFQTGFSLTEEGIQKSTDGKLKYSGKLECAIRASGFPLPAGMAY